MKTRKCGWTDLDLTVIGLGTWTYGGGGWQYSWGPQDDRESIRTIIRAFESGVNWLDTAPGYGLGHSEKVVGMALKELDDRPIVATKCAYVWNERRELTNSLKRDSVLREIDASIERLGVDVIDLYQIHLPNPEEDIEEAWEAIASQVEAGRIRYAGVSNFTIAQMERLRPIHPIASLQPPYSMFKRDVEKELLPYCAEHNIGVIVYSPLQKGLLTGKFSMERAASLPDDDHRKRDPMFTEPQLSVNLAAVEKLRLIADSIDMTPSQLAIAWTLRRPEVTSAIAGARRPSQIEETVAAGDAELSADVIDKIEAVLKVREETV